MNYYIKFGKYKPVKDIETLCEQREWKAVEYEIGMNNKTGNFFLTRVWGRIQCVKNWIRIFRIVKKKDVLMWQYPNHRNDKLVYVFLNILKKVKGVKLLVVIHDLEEIRKLNPVFVSEIRFLNLFDGIICHNERMKKYLIKRGICETKIRCLTVFPFLCEYDESKKMRSDAIIMLGNFSRIRCGFLYDFINEPLSFQVNLYGYNFEYSNFMKENFHFWGSYPDEKLCNIVDGKFGIVWNGDSIETCSGDAGRYLLINNPHKVSAFLSAGIPVIIWRKSAMAEFIKKQEVGILIDSLKEVEKVILRLSIDEYNRMKKNAEGIGKEIRAGSHFLSALDSIVTEINNV